MKKCSKCNHLKDLEEFAIDKKKKDGRYSSCKPCNNLFYKKNYSKGDRSPPRTDEEKRAARSKHYFKNKQVILKKQQAWRLKNKNIVKSLQRKWYEENGRRYAKNRYKQDLNFKISCIIRSRLNSAIKKHIKSGSAVSSLGCSVEQLKKYLESLFQPSMCWNNWGRGEGNWHIDHIIPLSCFDLSNPEELKKACHYSNLQPLWESENLSKKDKLI